MYGMIRSTGNHQQKYKKKLEPLQSWNFLSSTLVLEFFTPSLPQP